MTEAKRCPFHSRAQGYRCELEAGHEGICSNGGDGFVGGWFPPPEEPAVTGRRVRVLATVEWRPTLRLVARHELTVREAGRSVTRVVRERDLGDPRTLELARATERPVGTWGELEALFVDQGVYDPDGLELVDAVGRIEAHLEDDELGAFEPDAGKPG